MKNLKPVGVATEDEMKSFVKANGWYTLWNENNWVNNDVKNLDWGGRSLKSAYQQCLDDNEDLEKKILIKK